MYYLSISVIKSFMLQRSTGLSRWPWWFKKKKKNLPANAGDLRDVVQSLGWEDPLEKGMAIDASILAWGMIWIEEPSGLRSIGLERAGRD